MPFLSPLMGRQFLLELVKQLAPLRGVSAGVGECGVQRSLAVVALAQGFKNIGGVGHGAAVWGMWGCDKGAVGYLRTLRAAPTPMTASTTNTTAITRNSTNSTLAMPAAPAATPLNPRAPATREIRAKMMAYFSMVVAPCSGCSGSAERCGFGGGTALTVFWSALTSLTRYELRPQTENRAIARRALLPGCSAQRSSFIGLLPAEFGLFADEVAVGCGLLIDRAQQVQHLDDALRAQVEMLTHQRCQTLVRHHARAFRVHRDVHGLRAGSVGCRAVHLRWVLAAEGAAAVGAGTAVGVHDDLAAGQATVTLRAADDKTARGVDQVAGVLQPFLGQHGLDDLFDDGFGERSLHLGLRFALVGVVLGGEDHGVDAVGLAVHVAHRDLRLGVGAQERQAAVLAQLGLALDEAVRVVDGRGHQLGRFVAGVAEHQALVAGAGV